MSSYDAYDLVLKHATKSLLDLLLQHPREEIVAGIDVVDPPIQPRHDSYDLPVSSLS